MAEHSDLVAEIGMVEKMTTQERLKHAKKRRQVQLKKYLQYEKALDKENNKKKKGQGKQNNAKKPRQERNIKVQFVSNVMLLEAAARNDIEEVRNLLMLGVNPDVTNEDGLTALHQCCIDDLDEMMRLLVQFNANVNARDSELWTPLHAAATCGHVHLCKFLIEHGAELLAVNADGNMGYDICEDEVTLDFIENEMAKRGVTQELIDETRLSTEKKMLDELHDIPAQGKSLQYKGRNGESPLHIAAANGYIQVAEYLLSQQVAIDAQDDDSWQPIHAAACWGHLPILELLVHHGADLEARTKTGETPFDICEDIELKQRIMEMKDEIEASRTTHPKELTRRKSQNTRSPPLPHIVHSNAFSSGTFQSSATSLYNSTTSLSDKNPHSASVRRTSMREKSQISWKEAREEASRLRNSAASDEEEDEEEGTPNGHQSKPISEENNKIPVSNIDDIQVNLPDEATNGHRMVVTGPTPQSGPAVVTGGAVVTGPTPRPAPAVVTGPTARSAPASGVNSHQGSTNSLSKNAPHDHSKQEISGSNNSLRHQEVANANHDKASPSPATHPSDHHAPTGEPSSGPPSSVGAAHLPMGTLADLKKQRQQRQHDLKFKDQTGLDNEIQNYNANHVENNSTPAQPVSNGKNNSKARNNDSVYVISGSGDPPKKKFTATSEIVGGGDTNTSCCVIL